MNRRNEKKKKSLTTTYAISQLIYIDLFTCGSFCLRFVSFLTSIFAKRIIFCSKFLPISTEITSLCAFELRLRNLFLQKHEPDLQTLWLPSIFGPNRPALEYPSAISHDSHSFSVRFGGNFDFRFEKLKYFSSFHWHLELGATQKID